MPGYWRIAVVKGIRALARHLGLSIGTVSKALNGRWDINAETRQRILDAAAELGYVANQSGRALRQGSTSTVGFMIESNQAAPTDADNFFMTVFDGVQTVFRRHHLDLIVLPCASEENPREYLARMVARGFVDAIIISATRRDDPRIPLLQQAQVPFVTLGRSGDREAHPWVELDFEGVARASVKRLFERGHRRIAVALPAADLNLGNLFLDGYKAGLADCGIRFERQLAVRAESSERGGVELGVKLLSLEPPPTAVILSYELPAGGLYRALRQHGVEPGAGMAIIGFRDSPMTQHLVPSLTSFTTSLRDLGIALGETLLAHMPMFQAQHTGLPSQLVWPLELLPGESDPPLAVTRAARRRRPAATNEP
jgi:DNA-binding LacI/PurR family transcriptional regulator